MKRILISIVPAFIVAALVCAQPAFFRDEQVKVVGEIKYGQTSDKIDYTDKPLYRALYFDAQAGDNVDIKINSINGQALAALTDSRYKPIVSNFGSHVTAVLPPSAEPYPNRYFIVMQEERRKPSTFTVVLQKTGASAGAASTDYLVCKVDSDCVAVAKAGCCNNGYKEAVNKDKVDEYRAANTCKIAHPICAQIMIDDKRVAQCNVSAHQCEMVAAKSAAQ